MASRALRHLRRELFSTSPVSTSRYGFFDASARTRLFAARSITTSATRAAPNDPHTPSQKQAEQALLGKLSTLTPTQISALLSTPPGALPGAGSDVAGSGGGGGGGGSGNGTTVTTSRRGIFSRSPRLRKWSIRALFALVAFYVGFEVSESLIDASPLRFALFPPEGDLYVPSPDGGALDPGLARIEATMSLADELPLTRNLFPWGFPRPSEDPDGFVPGRRNPAYDYVVAASHHVPPRDGPSAANAPAASPSPLAMPSFQALSLPLSAPAAGGNNNPPYAGTPPAWPAHLHLLASDPATQARRKRHLVAGTYDSVHALGMAHHVFHDRRTGALSMMLLFGPGMCGWPGAVHGGAMATVMDEAMGRVATRTFPAKTAVTARLEMRYLARLEPMEVVVVKMAPMAEAEVRRKEAQLKRLAEQTSTSRTGAGSKSATPAAEEVKKNEASGSQEARSTGTGTGTGTGTPRSLQTDRKMWVVARMERAWDGELICEADGLFVVPKGENFRPVQDMW